MLQDICNCYMYLCSSKETMKEYEEKLLEKCFDANDKFELGHTQYQVYEPPFVTDIKNNNNM